MTAVSYISRRFLSDWLTQDDSTPLEPSIRQWMESKFGATLGEVRIHTGAGAALLCLGLGARAFSLGEDIVFGRGEYVPGTLAGRRLLAHELVHVLQQRSRTPPADSTLARVGEPQHPCEMEADQLAEAVLVSDRCPSLITPDRSGELRRAIRSVDLASASLSIESEDAAPGVAIMPPLHNHTPNGRRGRALAHLTRNFENIRSGFDPNAAQDYEAISAIHVDANVNVNLASPRDQIVANGYKVAGWDFQFIQLAQQFIQVMYVGRNPFEGRLTLNYTLPPAYPARCWMQWCLDSNDPQFNGEHPMPFYALSQPIIQDAVDTRSGSGRPLPAMKKITNSMDDHPWMSQPLNWTINSRELFLFRITRSFQAVTVFVARNEQNAIQPLASVRWAADWRLRFQWRNYRPTPINENPSGFDVGQWAKGAPTDLMSKIVNPPMDVSITVNAADARAAQAIYDHPNDMNVKFVGAWTSDIPGDFFT